MWLKKARDDVEYDRLAYMRRAGIRTRGTNEGQLFIASCRRVHERYPITQVWLAWHEAGHAVVEASAIAFDLEDRFGLDPKARLSFVESIEQTLSRLLWPSSSWPKMRLNIVKT